VETAKNLSGRDQGLNDQLEKLILDLAHYRESVDQLLLPTDVSGTRQWREQLFEILICASQLYLDYLLLMRALPSLESISVKASGDLVPRLDIHREASLRKGLKERLKSVPHWKHFDPRNAFSKLTGLQTLEDYIDRLVLHLPEIYEESLHVEDCTRRFLTVHDEAILTELVIGMEHMGRNHIAFVQQALEWAANETGWDEE
jgi:hypothetical protein